jgi:hypothetical protein
MKQTKEKQSILSKVTAGVAVAGIVAGTVLGALAFPVQNDVIVPSEPIVETVTVTNTVIEQVEVPVEVIVEKEVIVQVDNGNLALVLDTIYEADGDVEYLLDGLYDDEVDKIVERIVLTNDMKAEAENIIKANFIKELDRQHSFDKRDVSRVKLDSEDTTISNIDFKYKDSDVATIVEFRFEGSIYVAEVELPFYNGKAQTMSITSVSLK